MDSNELTCISLHESATRSASVGVSTHYYDQDLIQRDWLVAGQERGDNRCAAVNPCRFMIVIFFLLFRVV